MIRFIHLLYLKLLLFLLIKAQLYQNKKLIQMLATEASKQAVKYDFEMIKAFVRQHEWVNKTTEGENKC